MQTINDPAALAVRVFKARFYWVNNYFSPSYIMSEILPEIRQLGWVVALETGMDSGKPFWNGLQRAIYEYLTKRHDFRKTKPRNGAGGGYIPKFSIQEEDYGTQM